MQLLLLSDIHGRSDQLKRIKNEILRADLILLSGDMTHFGHLQNIEEIIEWIMHHNSKLLTVPGNCDTYEVDAYLSEKEINLHADSKVINGFTFVGMGGSLPGPGNTPLEFSEKEFESVLTQTFGKLESEHPVILMTHQPPQKSAADRISPFVHVGSKSLRRIIEKYEPLLSVCGHIHESRGKAQIGRTWVVNPGPMKNGNYAVIELSDQVDSIKFSKV